MKNPPPRPDASVACNACSACCATRVGLLTKDDLDAYEHKTMLADEDPAAAAAYLQYDPSFTGYVLRRDADGVCVYATDAGCSIYARRPTICRAFSCVNVVRWIRSLPADEAADYREIAESDVFQAGLERLLQEAALPV